MLVHNTLSDTSPERTTLINPGLIQWYIQEALKKFNSSALYEPFSHSASPDTIIGEGNTALTLTLKRLIDPDLLGVRCSFSDPEARDIAKAATRGHFPFRLF